MEGKKKKTNQREWRKSSTLTILINFSIITIPIRWNGWLYITIGRKLGLSPTCFTRNNKKEPLISPTKGKEKNIYIFLYKYIYIMRILNLISANWWVYGGICWFSKITESGNRMWLTQLQSAEWVYFCFYLQYLKYSSLYAHLVFTWTSVAGLSGFQK